MLKKILIAFAVLAAIVGAFLIYVALQPSDFRIERQIKINAPADVVFAQVHDFHNWEAWSPWAKLDPKAKNTFKGPASGKGAIFSWAGNDEVGEGQMTITESEPSKLIRIKLDFIKPFEDTCTTEFKFKSADKETEVTWTMSGEKNFVSKMVCMFMNMDKMVGGDFEKGLGQMKSVAETAAKKEEKTESPPSGPTSP